MCYVYCASNSFIDSFFNNSFALNLKNIYPRPLEAVMELIYLHIYLKVVFIVYCSDICNKETVLKYMHLTICLLSLMSNRKSTNKNINLLPVNEISRMLHF